jgi:hypothetical protein
MQTSLCPDYLESAFVPESVTTNLVASSDSIANLRRAGAGDASDRPSHPGSANESRRFAPVICDCQTIRLRIIKPMPWLVAYTETA